MKLIRPARAVAAIIMLVGMLMMQISIAACRCLETAVDIQSIAAVHLDDARSALADDLRANADEHLAHDAQDHQDHFSCNNCIKYLELAKKLSDSTDHPRVAPFTPSSLHLVLDRAPAVALAPVLPGSGCDHLAGAPQLHIQHCSYQL